MYINFTRKKRQEKRRDGKFNIVVMSVFKGLRVKGLGFRVNQLRVY